MGVYIEGLTLVQVKTLFDMIGGEGLGDAMEHHLTEVEAPHGRLIDADKLIEEFTWCKEQVDNYNKEHWQDIIDRVNRVKTIIDKED